MTRVRFDGEGSGKERFMRTILWTIGVIVGVVMLFAGFTKSCDMISAPSTVRMVSGFVLLGLLVGAVIAGGVTMLKRMG